MVALFSGATVKGLIRPLPAGVRRACPCAAIRRVLVASDVQYGQITRGSLMSARVRADALDRGPPVSARPPPAGGTEP